MELNQTTLESYNKQLQKGQGTLIGNWWEERELRDVTGIGRSAHNYAKLKSTISQTGAQSLYKESPQIESVNDTNERTMGKKFNHIPNTTNSEYGKGFNKADQLPRTGPVHLRTQQQMINHIKQELNEIEQQKEIQRNVRYFQTTTQTEFGAKEHAMAGCTVGRRVMRTQNGQPITPDNRDEDILVDHGFLERQPFLTDEELKNQLPQGESYLTQQPITYWTEKTTDGFGCVYQSKSNPNDPKSTFKLNNQFLKTFHDYSHVRK
ncbi:hypothetical protein ABPG74_010708 [Tetrahymena malaccensis]